MLRPYSSQTSVGVITGNCAEYDLDDDEDEEVGAFASMYGV